MKGSQIEVWGTMENSTLLLLEQSHNTWRDSHLRVHSRDPTLRPCSYIAFTSFTDSSGEEAEHVWMAFWQSAELVSFDARTKKQRIVLNCSKKGEFN